MQVKDFVKDVTVQCAAGFERITPAVSIIMLTDSACSHADLARAVKSVVQQKFGNFELLVVGGNSDRELARQMKPLPANDARIAFLGYEADPGLLAVSANLGIERARGQKLLLIDEHCELFADGLEELYQHQIRSGALGCYGKTKYLSHLGDAYWLGESKADSKSIKYSNYLPLESFLFDREIFEQLGLFDPHIAAADFFDWDMWCRAMEFCLEPADVAVSKKHGDSRYRTLPKNEYPQILEWLQTHRNGRLQKNNWRNYEIVEPPTFLSYPGQLRVDRINQRLFGDRRQMLDIRKRSDVQGYVLLLGEVAVSGEIVFSVLEGRTVLNLDIPVFLHYLNDFIAGARCIVINRIINETMVRLAGLFCAGGIPYYYYLDDYLMSPDYPNLYTDPVNRKAAEFYSTDAVKVFLKEAQGIIVSTHALADKMKLYNPNIVYMPCTTPVQSLRHNHDNYDHFISQNEQTPIGIGYFSSITKIKYFLDLKNIFEELHQKTGRMIKLYIPCLPDSRPQLTQFFADCDYVDLKLVDRENNYTHFVAKGAREKLHFIIHVFNKDELNNTDFYQYKTFNILLTAHLCNVIPLIPLRPPFDDLKAKNPVLGELIVDSNQELAGKMANILTDFSLCRRYSGAIKDYVDRHYPLKHNQVELQKILDRHPALCDVEPSAALCQCAVKALSIPLPRLAVTNERTAPVAKYYQPDQVRPVILLHCPNLGYFYRNELILSSLPGKKILVYIESCTVAEIGKLARENREIDLTFCTDLNFVINHIAGIGLVISPYILPLEAHRSFFPVIKIAKALGIKVLGIQHGLFQLGINQFDEARNRLGSYLPLALTVPIVPCSDAMLSWTDAQNGIGYPRNLSKYSGVKDEGYVLILSNLNWHIYSSEERLDFVTAVIRLAEAHPEQTFIWGMHPGEKILDTCHAVRLHITAAESAKILAQNHPAKAYPTERAIASARMIISMPSTVLLDAEAYNRPVILFDCAGNRDLNRQFVQKQLFHDYRELKGLFADALANPQNSLLQTGMFYPFNIDKLNEYIETYMLKSRVNGAAAVTEILDFYRSLDRQLPADVAVASAKNSPAAAAPAAATPAPVAGAVLHHSPAFTLKNDLVRFAAQHAYLDCLRPGAPLTLAVVKPLRLRTMPEYHEFWIPRHEGKAFLICYLNFAKAGKVLVEWIFDNKIVGQSVISPEKPGALHLKLPPRDKKDGRLLVRFCKTNAVDEIEILVLRGSSGKKLAHWTLM